MNRKNCYSYPLRLDPVVWNLLDDVPEVLLRLNLDVSQIQNLGWRLLLVQDVLQFKLCIRHFDVLHQASRKSFKNDKPTQISFFLSPNTPQKLARGKDVSQDVCLCIFLLRWGAFYVAHPLKESQKGEKKKTCLYWPNILVRPLARGEGEERGREIWGTKAPFLEIKRLLYQFASISFFRFAFCKPLLFFFKTLFNENLIVFSSEYFL